MKRLLFSLFFALIIVGALPLLTHAAGCSGTGACYWVGGTGNVNDTTKWATSSGGATTGGLPTISDDCIFDSASNATAYTVTVNAALACKSVNIAAPASGDMTLTGAQGISIPYNWFNYSTMVNTYTGILTFNSSSTATTTVLTSNGVMFSGSITINASNTIQLADNLTVSSTKTLTLTYGTLNFNNKNVSTGLFSSNNANLRNLVQGSGAFILTGSGTVWDMGTLTNYPTSTQPGITIANNSTSTKTISVVNSLGFRFSSVSVSSTNAGVVSLPNTASFGVVTDRATGASSTLSLSGSATLDSLDMTGFSGALILTGSATILGSLTTSANTTWTGVGALSIGGSLTLASGTVNAYTATLNFISTSTSPTSVITSNGIIFPGGITIVASNTVQLADNLTMASTSTLILTAGTLDFNNHNLSIGFFSSSASTPRTLTQGSGTFTLTGTGGNIWTTSTMTNMTFTTNPTVTVTNSSSTGKAFASSPSNVFAGIIISSSTASSVTLGQNANYGLVVDQATGASSTLTLNGNGVSFTGLDLSNFSGTFIDNFTLNIYGSATTSASTVWTGVGSATIWNNLTLASGMTNQYSGTLTVGSTSTSPTAVITSNGNIFPGGITIFASNTVQLADALTLASTSTLTLTAGTLDFNNKNVSTGFFSSSGSTARTLTPGSGTFTLTGAGTIWSTATLTNMTFTTNPAVIVSNSSSTGKVFSASAANTFASVTITSSTASSVTFSNANFGAVVDPEAGASSTLALGAAATFGSLDLTGFTGTFLLGGGALTTMGNITMSPSTTWSGVNTLTIQNAGSLTMGSGMTNNYTGGITFNSTSTATSSTITSNGIAFNSAFTINSSNTVRLADNFTSTSTQIFTLTSGTFDANGKNVSIGQFSSSNSNTRALTMGSGTWTLTGVGTIWTTQTATNMTIVQNTSPILISNSSSTNKTFTFSGTNVSNDALGDILIATGTAGQISFTGSPYFHDLILTNTGASTTLGNVGTVAGAIHSLNFANFAGSWGGTFSFNMTGDLNLSTASTNNFNQTITFTATSTSATSTLTTNGVLLKPGITINASNTLRLADDLTASSSATLALTAGTFESNNHNVSIGAIASTGNVPRTWNWGSGTWNLTGVGVMTLNNFSGTNITFDHRPTLNVTGNGLSGGGRSIGFVLAESQNPDVYVTTGVDTIFINNGTRVHNLDFTGYSGQLSFLGGGAQVQGNVILSPTMTVAQIGNGFNFIGTTGIQTFTSNGVTMCGTFSIGAGGATTSSTLRLLDDLKIGSSAGGCGVNLINGTLDANDHNVTIYGYGLFSSTDAGSLGTDPRTLKMGSGTWTMINPSDAQFSFDIENFPATNIIAGSSTLILDAMAGTTTFAGGSYAYNNVWVIGSSTTTRVITGNNTFNDLKIDPGRTVQFANGSTQTVSSFTAIGTVTEPITISSTSTTPHYLVYNGTSTVHGEYLTISNSHASPANTWYAGSDYHWVDGGGNTGWIFPPVPTITANVSGSGYGTVTSDNGDIHVSYPSASSGASTITAGGSISITAKGNSGTNASLDCGSGITVTSPDSETSYCSMTNVTASTSVSAVFTRVATSIGGNGGGGGGGSIISAPPVTTPPVVTPPTTTPPVNNLPVTPPVSGVENASTTFHGLKITKIPEVYSSNSSLSPNGCPAYLSSYIKFGANNSGDAVLKLQHFLRDESKIAPTLSDSGTYDTSSFVAVKEFQAWYPEAILAPWGLTQPTGYVYITTLRKINLLMCELHPERYTGNATVQVSTDTYSRVLQLGSIGEDVRSLQKYLNTHGFAVTTTGLGSLGSETTKFGAGTRAALIKFQEAHAEEILKPAGFTQGTGIFGGATRRYVESHP